MLRRCLGPALCAWMVALLLVPAGAHASRPLALGFFDGVFTGPDSGLWLGRAAAAGSSVVRIDIGWVAPDTPNKPTGFDAGNPADPHYDFTHADAVIKAATADGLKVIIDFTGAPRWAQGPGMPVGTSPGAWRPSPAAIHDYAVALAKRYSGRFADPSDPFRMLPRAWAFQLWNEPNLSGYLAPQWVGNTAEAPILYRAMLNAFYAGIKSIDPHALVVTAGTGPFGDPQPGGQRIMPARFWRDVLCVKEIGPPPPASGPASSQLIGGSCSDPAHFDVLAHHPYSVGAPSTSALNADDVSIPDMGKLTRILRVAERAGQALPHIHHQIWVTETGYNTKPPNPQGVPVVQAAHWLAQALEMLWSQGVSLITWNTIVDQAPAPSYSVTSQSGVYYLGGAPKPGLQAFVLPLVAARENHDHVMAWVRSPVAGLLRIQSRDARGVWRTVRASRVSAGYTLLTHLVDTAPITLRAQLGGRVSLTDHVS